MVVVWPGRIASGGFLWARCGGRDSGGQPARCGHRAGGAKIAGRATCSRATRESPVSTPRAQRKRPASRPMLLRHEFPTVKERLDAAEVRIDFLEAQMKATLKRHKELTDLFNKMQRPAPIHDDITRLYHGTKAVK